MPGVTEPDPEAGAGNHLAQKGEPSPAHSARGSRDEAQATLSSLDQGQRRGCPSPAPAAVASPGDCSHGGRPHPRTTVTPSLLVLCRSLGPPSPRGPSPSLLPLLGSLLLLCPQSGPRARARRKQRGGAGRGGAGAPSPTTESKFKLNRKQTAATTRVLRAPPPGPASDDFPASCIGAKFEQPGTRSPRWPHVGPGAGLGDISGTASKIR